MDQEICELDPQQIIFNEELNNSQKEGQQPFELNIPANNAQPEQNPFFPTCINAQSSANNNNNKRAATQQLKTRPNKVELLQKKIE